MLLSLQLALWLALFGLCGVPPLVKSKAVPLVSLQVFVSQLNMSLCYSWAEVGGEASFLCAEEIDMWYSCIPD